MVPSDDEPKPRIIIDEDWKSQVEREKNAARQQPPEQAADSLQADPEDDAEDDAMMPPEVADDDRGLPPASFSLVVSTFVTQALVALGQIPEPETNRPVIRLRLAQHYIDTLAVLESKTQGNLAPEEAHMLDNALHELRMAYVYIQNAVAQKDS